MGKSATGKDQVYHTLLEDPELSLKPMVLYTTRPMREGETNGCEYYFIDESEMNLLKKGGKIIESRCYRTVHGPWYYFTAADERIELQNSSYLTIGTVESFVKVRDYYKMQKEFQGSLADLSGNCVIPLYIESDDGIRLEHAIKREKKQEHPDYRELCRRFLADSEDFSEEKLLAAGITGDFRIQNNTTKEELYQKAREYILQYCRRK
jgi:guanylate kinase